MKKFDLTWGESVCVRDAFLDSISKQPIYIGFTQLHKFGYPKHEGDPALVEVTRKVIERQTGLTYKHILLTNGASGGVTVALRAYKQMRYNVCFTRSAPYFTLYPSMIKAAGYTRHATEGDSVGKDDLFVGLIDSPTNPQGIVIHGKLASCPIVWDAVYHNNVYMNVATKPLEHHMMIGSYSKLTGLNGLRVGWIATNDDSLVTLLSDLVTAEYCGLSTANTVLLLDLLKDFDWEKYEKNARDKLDHNREEWSKLERFFGGSEVKPVGMFYYAYMDKACKKLISNAGVEWMSSDRLGATSDLYGRFNLGQDNKLVKAAVKAVLKLDKLN